MADDRDLIYVCFLKDLHPTDESMSNFITNKIGRLLHGIGTHHVELCIPSNNGAHCLSTSVYQNELVCTSSEKTFRNPGYHVFTIPVSTQGLNRMKQLIKLHASITPFSALGMYSSILPVQIFPEVVTGGTFCSKYVTELLKVGGVESVNRLNPNIVTPSKLFRVISKNSNVLGSVAHKKSLMQGNVMEMKPLIN